MAEGTPSRLTLALFYFSLRRMLLSPSAIRHPPWLAVVVLACLWAAEAPAQPVRRDSIIDLVYLGGPDCPYCRAWEAKELPKLRAMEEFKHIRFTHVLKKIPEPVPLPEGLPAHLKPMYGEMIRLTKNRGGSPQFVLLLDGVAVRGGFGTPTYHSLLPVMTELVNSKTKAKVGSRKSEGVSDSDPRSAGVASPITHYPLRLSER
jgi:hypothetical protein